MQPIPKNSSLNTKMDNLARLSTDKTRRGKAPKTNSVMVAVQPLVQPAPAAAPLNKEVYIFYTTVDTINGTNEGKTIQVCNST